MFWPKLFGHQQIVREIDFWAAYYALDAHVSEVRENTSVILKRLNNLLEDVKRWQSEYEETTTLGEKRDIANKEAEAVRDVAGDVSKLVGGYKGLLDAPSSPIRKSLPDSMLMCSHFAI